jgi:hypothetical protein
MGKQAAEERLVKVAHASKDKGQKTQTYHKVDCSILKPFQNLGQIEKEITCEKLTVIGECIGRQWAGRWDTLSAV